MVVSRLRFSEDMHILHQESCLLRKPLSYSHQRLESALITTLVVLLSFVEVSGRAFLFRPSYFSSLSAFHRYSNANRNHKISLNTSYTQIEPTAQHG